MGSSRKQRRGTRRTVDRIFDVFDVLPQVLAVAILGAVAAGFGASRLGGSDDVPAAALGGFVVLFAIAAFVAVVRDRRRG